MNMSILILAGGGGHTGYAYALAQALLDKAFLSFIVPEDDTLSQKKLGRFDRVDTLIKARGFHRLSLDGSCNRRPRLNQKVCVFRLLPVLSYSSVPAPNLCYSRWVRLLPLFGSVKSPEKHDIELVAEYLSKNLRRVAAWLERVAVVD